MTTAVQFEEWTIHDSPEALTTDEPEGTITLEFDRPLYGEADDDQEQRAPPDKWLKRVSEEELRALVAAAEAFLKLRDDRP